MRSSPRLQASSFLVVLGLLPVASLAAQDPPTDVRPVPIGGTNWSPPSPSEDTGAGFRTSTLSANELANLVIAGNITLSGNATLTGNIAQAGRFTGGIPASGIDIGVILSSGNIASFAPGPNSSDSIATVFNGPGDAALTTLAGQTTFDASVLSFNFTVSGLTAGQKAGLQFQYVFASDEYNEFVNDIFNDVFAFFLNNVNITVLPDLITPVAINNLNCGNPFAPPNGGPFCNLFRNNDCSDIPPNTFPCAGNVPSQMDGLTVLLTAIGSVTGPGPHNIKLAIADAGDASFDSNVLILGDSLTASAKPTCISPTPAVELGAAPIAAQVNGGAIKYNVLAIDNSGVVGGTATIASVTAEEAVLTGGVCGTFGASSVLTSTNKPVHNPFPTTGQPATTSFSWSPNASQVNKCYRFTYNLTGGLSSTNTCRVIVSVSPQAECFLLIGRDPLDWPLPFSPSDHIHALPELVFALSGPVDLPIFKVPDDPFLFGVHLYSQVYMDNPFAYPSDQYKVSNGVDITLGLGAKSFGTSTGMTLWVQKAPLLGGSLAHWFSIDVPPEQ